MQEKNIACVPSVDGKIHPSGFVQEGGNLASLVTACAALRPRDGFSHPHQEHMKYTYITDTLFYCNVLSNIFMWSTYVFQSFKRLYKRNF